ncbi:3-hydroxyacyl-CoA dehydrogenase type-2-like [Frieseomelitta varia]|uniref:3-hydroxyacyl-CoA dehydrogenase type-2-like n=1 Tax=Frieseomelitta varia TaxID=561572 RepID=UPI001CB67DF8|nr:3-hydroxyacyl-CoA dehydrogenase type-2-like [Frieseomelitta varia]
MFCSRTPIIVSSDLRFETRPTVPSLKDRERENSRERWRGRVAYITGGANGIGKAIAQKIHCQGAKVVLADISCNGAKVAEGLGEKALFTCTDVRLEKDVVESMKCVKEKFGGVNVLINSAGVVGYEPIYDFKKKKPHSVDLYKCLYDTNVWGLFNVTRLMVGLMAENKPDANRQRGVIINLSSMIACESPPGLIAYGSTKSAVSGMTIPLARGLACKGIRVIGICPGFIDSPMTAPQKPEERKKWINMKLTPKRYGTCEEVAHLVQACIENPLINGENIRIDMGFRYNQEGDAAEQP